MRPHSSAKNKECGIPQAGDVASRHWRIVELPAAPRHPINYILPPFPLRDPVILISILRSGSGMMSLKGLKEYHYTTRKGIFDILIFENLSFSGIMLLSGR
jgi:hypothetical protein